MANYYYKVFKWQGDPTQPYQSNFQWKNGRVLLPKRTTFSCARVVADVGDRQDYYDSIAERNDIISRNRALIDAGLMGGSIGGAPVGHSLSVNGDYLDDVPTEPSYSGDFNLTLNVYADESLVFTKDIYASDRPFRIGQGYRALKWEIELHGNVPVKRFDMATSMEELKKIMVAKEGG